MNERFQVNKTKLLPFRLVISLVNVSRTHAALDITSWRGDVVLVFSIYSKMCRGPVLERVYYLGHFSSRWKDLESENDRDIIANAPGSLFFGARDYFLLSHSVGISDECDRGRYYLTRPVPLKVSNRTKHPLKISARIDFAIIPVITRLNRIRVLSLTAPDIQ